MQIVQEYLFFFTGSSSRSWYLNNLNLIGVGKDCRPMTMQFRYTVCCYLFNFLQGDAEYKALCRNTFANNIFPFFKAKLLFTVLMEEYSFGFKHFLIVYKKKVTTIPCVPVVYICWTYIKACWAKTNKTWLKRRRKKYQEMDQFCSWKQYMYNKTWSKQPVVNRKVSKCSSFLLKCVQRI